MVGDIAAGYYAKRMGLPIDHLLVATNANDILHKFFSKGEYHKASEVTPTCTPSMDIHYILNQIHGSLWYMRTYPSSKQFWEIPLLLIGRELKASVWLDEWIQGHRQAHSLRGHPHSGPIWFQFFCCLSSRHWGTALLIFLLFPFILLF